MIHFPYLKLLIAKLSISIAFQHHIRFRLNSLGFAIYGDIISKKYLVTCLWWAVSNIAFPFEIVVDRLKPAKSISSHVPLSMVPHKLVQIHHLQKPPMVSCRMIFLHMLCFCAFSCHFNFGTIFCWCYHFTADLLPTNVIDSLLHRSRPEIFGNSYLVKSWCISFRKSDRSLSYTNSSTCQLNKSSSLHEEFKIEALAFCF